MAISTITEINKTDTFLLYGEIYCVMDVIECNQVRNVDTATGEVYHTNHVDYVCENVLDESDVIKWDKGNLLCLFNNPESFAH